MGSEVKYYLLKHVLLFDLVEMVISTSYSKLEKKNGNFAAENKL